MNISVAKIARIMSEMVPARLAEDWDNVGLQVGHNDKEVKIILCALDFSAEVLEQAIQLHADIIITHHPAIFRGIKQFTDADWRTALLLEAARHDIAVYSAHTNLDSVTGGVNDVLASLLELENVEGLSGEDTLEGIGRIGTLTAEAGTYYRDPGRAPGTYSGRLRRQRHGFPGLRGAGRGGYLCDR